MSWKTLKVNCTETYDDWLATERVDNETEASNLEAPPRIEIVKLIIDALAVPPSEMIQEWFLHCVTSLSIDGSRTILFIPSKKDSRTFEVISSEFATCNIAS